MEGGRPRRPLSLSLSRPLRGLTGPAGEEAGDLMGCVPLEGIAADVVAGQGGLGTGLAQQSLDVAQGDAVVSPTVPTVRRKACGPIGRLMPATWAVRAT